MRRFIALMLSAAAGLAALELAADDKLPAGTWTPAQVRAVLDKTVEIRLAPNLADLRPGHARALDRLLEAGAVFQSLFEDMRHPQAHDARIELARLRKGGTAAARVQGLVDLYRLFKGPIATTADNRRVPFLPVKPEVPGRNVYPAGLTRDEIQGFLESHPERKRLILHPRSMVRRSNAAALTRDMAVLDRHPTLKVLHPDLEPYLRLLSRSPGREALYAVPYPVAFPEATLKVHGLLWKAAGHVQDESPDFASYLRHRARDLLTNDYEAGDAAWVTGRFGELNAEIGTYESYDDGLLGLKTFPAVSVLVRNEPRSREVRKALGSLQAIENALPYQGHKQVRNDIPVGVYDVIADFGQARGTNTASILPNESHIVRKYGRTILLRANIMTHPAVFSINQGRWKAALAPEHHEDLTREGGFQRTLWHENGHYLGPDRDRRGRTLGEALQENADLLEEMKSDLASLFAAHMLERSGQFDAAQLKAIYAGGVRRVLQRVKPRREQPYQTMQLMQMNYFLEHGLLIFDEAAGVLRIQYERYPEVIEGLLEQVLELQAAGDKDAAEAFVQKYTTWNSSPHEALARRMRDAERYRHRLVRYAALGE